MTTWNNYYLPSDPTTWKGRKEIPPSSCIFQIMQTVNLLETQLIDVPHPVFTLLGFKCDIGVERNLGRVGAIDGPQALRQALAKLPIHKANLNIMDVGNIICTNGDLESSQQALAEVIAILLHNKTIPIVLGGGHELAWGHYQGIVRCHRNKKLGIINFDSHFDMRPLISENKGHSGTPFLQIAKAHERDQRPLDYNCIGIQHTGNIPLLFETAKKYGTHIILADELHQGQQQRAIDFIDRVVDENQLVYLSLCLDVFASAFAPGVSAIQPLGLFPWHIIPLLRQAAASGKVISYDIAELSPRYDIDHCTAKLGANLIYEIIHHHSDQPMPW